MDSYSIYASIIGELDNNCSSLAYSSTPAISDSTSSSISSSTKSPSTSTSFQSTSSHIPTTSTLASTTTADECCPEYSQSDPAVCKLLCQLFARRKREALEFMPEHTNKSTVVAAMKDVYVFLYTRLTCFNEGVYNFGTYEH